MLSFELKDALDAEGEQPQAQVSDKTIKEITINDTDNNSKPTQKQEETETLDIPSGKSPQTIKDIACWSCDCLNCK